MEKLRRDFEKKQKKKCMNPDGGFSRDYVLYLEGMVQTLQRDIPRGNPDNIDAERPTPP